MYITITEIVGEKTIGPAYLIKSTEVTVIRMFSDNIQYKIEERLKVLLITNEEKLLLKGKFPGSELSQFVGRKVITTPLDTNKNVVKTDKLAGVTEFVLSLDELCNTDNLKMEDFLLRYYVTDSSRRDLKTGSLIP